MQKDWFAVFKFRVTVRVHLIKYDCYYYIAELLLCLQPSLVGWYIIISWGALCKNLIVGFKVKITVKVRNFIDSLCILYFLYH